MDTKLFVKLMKSMDEAKEIIDGKMVSHRVTEITPEQLKQMIIETDKLIEEDISNAEKTKN